MGMQEGVVVDHRKGTILQCEHAHRALVVPAVLNYCPELFFIGINVTRGTKIIYKLSKNL